MSPTEYTILSNFLLPPAPLPTIVSLAQFTSYFPRAQQSSPQIKRLYRDLQHQRSFITDKVTTSITTECKRGNGDRLQVIRSRRESERGAGQGRDEEVEVEEAMFNGKTSNLPTVKDMHSLRSIVGEMEKAAEDLEEEIRRDEEEIERLEVEMRGVIGGLSDLRYGRLANGELRDQVLEGLARMGGSCELGR